MGWFRRSEEPNLPDDVTARELLRALLSGESDAVFSAACRICTLRGPSTLDALSDRVDQIEYATRRGLPGGTFYPKQRHLDFAVRKLRFWHDKAACLCQLYPSYEYFDPDREVADGHTVILDFIAQERRRRVRCTHCGELWDVFDEDYHFWWWKWSRASSV